MSGNFLGKLKKHYTFKQTGIMTGNCKKVSGTAGVDVDNFYYYPNAEVGQQIEICCRNTHYGYARLGEDGLLHDNSNRSVFEVV